MVRFPCIVLDTPPLFADVTVVVVPYLTPENYNGITTAATRL